MCGRFCIDNEIAKEIEKLVWDIEDHLKQELLRICLVPRDIHPSEMAPVLEADVRGLHCRMQRWGFPGFDGKQLIFNARSESALEKRMFQESVGQRRIVVPATRFYEWNRKKEKNTFCRKDQPVLFMAGFYNKYQGEERFVILTTAANDSMRPVHDRMPLMLEQSEIRQWLGEDCPVEAFLQKVPALLERHVEYEQISLFCSKETNS